MGGGPSYIRPLTTPPLCPWGYYPSGRVHKALDFPTPVGTKFRVARNGVVKVAGWSTTGFGNHIRVLMDDGNTVIYGHLSRFLVSVGQRVTAGQFIGLTGNTGNSTGPHLHMEVRSSSWAPWTAWDYTPFLVSAPTTTTATATPTTTAPSFLERIMALSATDQNTFNGAVATALVYSLRNAGTVQLEIGKLIDRTVLEILNYKNTDIGVTKDVYAFIRGEEGTGRTNKDIAGAVDFSAVLNALAAIRTDLDALKTTVEALPKAEPAPVPAPPAAVPFHGVDVSSYQDSVLDTWIASEDFLIAKATEGKGFNAPSYAAQIAKIRASGKKPGAYHYAWPENGWQADFDHFVSVAGLKVGEVGALDFEPWSSKQPNADPATFPAYVVGWADAFKARFGVDPLFYAPDYFVRSIKANATPEQWARISVLPFWKPGNKGVYVTDPIAGYGDTFGFQTLAMWQWTDRPLDRNILYVDWSTLAVKEA